MVHELADTDSEGEEILSIDGDVDDELDMKTSHFPIKRKAARCDTDSDQYVSELA